MRARLSKEEQDEIVISYLEDTAVKNILKRFLISETTLYNVLKRNGIKRIGRSRFATTVDSDYFALIDSERKSYFLGLMFADGYNSVDLIKKTYVASIFLQHQDEDIVKALAQDIGFKGNINRYQDKRSDRYQDRVGFSVYNKEFCINLDATGCVRNKSLILEFPTVVPKLLIPHFIRGYLDGDGTIGVYENRLHISMVGTERFISTARNFILDNDIIVKMSKIKDKSLWRLQATSSTEGIKLIDLLYKDATVYLKRKFDKWLEFRDKNYDRVSKTLLGISQAF